jgi:hypothetical protein
MDPKAVQKWDENAVGEWIRLQLMMMMDDEKKKKKKEEERWRREWMKY